MKRCFAALAACAALSAVTASAGGLTVSTYTAPPEGFSVSSHLVQGEREAILVDAQFTLADAGKVVELVKRSGKRLKYVVVTHGHPDHFFGLEVVQHAFPEAKVVATPAVIADIQDYGPKAIARWKPVFKDSIPDAFVTPQPIRAPSIVLEGQEIQLLALDGTESAHATVLWIPSTGALITGDLVFNKVHLWLRENRPDGWIGALDRLAKLQPSAVYPGHGAPGGAELIAANRRYIETFVTDTAAPATQEEAGARLKQQYAEYALPVIVDLSVQGRLQR